MNDSLKKFVSVEINLKVNRTDCFVFELPEGVSREEFEAVLDKYENSQEFLSHFIDCVGMSVKGVKISHHTQGAENGELEIYTVESGDLYSNGIDEVTLNEN